MMYGFGIGISPVNRLFSGGGGLNPLWDGLLAYYTADSTANDALGTYNGTLVNGATYGTGIINNGFNLDGINDYASISPTFGSSLTAPTSAFTYSAWVYKTKSGQAFIVQNGTVDMGCCLFVTSGGFVGLTYQGVTQQTSSSISAGFVNLNTWHHLVAAYDGAGSVTFYNDGADVGTKSISWTDGTGTSNTYIGTYSGISNYFGGIIDEVGVWDRQLTASEVTDLYNSGAGLQY